MKYELHNIDTEIMNTFKTISPELSDFHRTILYNRLNGNIDNYKDYIYNNLIIDKDLEKLKDVDKASVLINKHIDNESHIAIVCDCDSDGINSGVVSYLILIIIFNYKPENISVFVNRRITGNGYSSSLMDRITTSHKERKIDLIISSDHGSSNNKEFGILKCLDIDMVITDHHEIPVDNFPINATVFVNNQREDSEYSKDVSGCFVVFLVLIATYRDRFKTTNYDVFNPILPYVAITTITDVMSLSLPLNRHMVRVGLNEINSYRNKLWMFINKKLGITGEITSKHLGFTIGPLVNTGNRVDREQLVFDLLKSNTFETVNDNLEALVSLNTYRKNVTKKLVKVEKDKLDFSKFKYSIVALLETELSVAGIIASNIGEGKRLPTVCFIENENGYVGSCRSVIANVHMLDILHEINSIDNTIFIKYGGHEGAAGCSIHPGKLEPFKNIFDNICKDKILAMKDKDTIYVDMEVDDIGKLYTYIKPMESLAPFGKNWIEPIFMTRMKIKRIFSYGTISKIVLIDKKGNEIVGKHFFKRQNNFDSKNISEHLDSGDMVDVIYNFSTNFFSSNLEFSMDIIYIGKV